MAREDNSFRDASKAHQVGLGCSVAVWEVLYAAC